MKGALMKNKLLIAILTILLLCAVCVCASAEVRINEVMASNAVFINGRHDDWVELYNDGDTQVSLKG